jgi:hypothetical protein
MAGLGTLERCTSICVLIHGAVFGGLGIMDERYFVYGEDVDIYGVLFSPRILAMLTGCMD